LASHPVNAKNNLIHKFFGKRLALSILSGSIRLDYYRIWTTQYFSGLVPRYLAEISARWLRQLSSGVLRDFAVVDPASHPCFVDETGAKDEQIYLEKSSLRDWN
jgi:hypothetical protein